MEGCDCTYSCGMDSTHSTWCKQKGDLVPGTSLLLSCLQLSSTPLVAPMLGSSGFFSLYKPAQRNHPCPSSYHRPLTLLTGPKCFCLACWARLSFVHRDVVCTTFTPTSLLYWPVVKKSDPPIFVPPGPKISKYLDPTEQKCLK